MTSPDSVLSSQTTYLPTGLHVSVTLAPLGASSELTFRKTNTIFKGLKRRREGEKSRDRQGMRWGQVAPTRDFRSRWTQGRQGNKNSSQNSTLLPQIKAAMKDFLDTSHSQLALLTPPRQREVLALQYLYNYFNNKTNGFYPKLSHI